MTGRRDETWRRLEVAVRRILVEEWDPIRWGEGCPPDEYDHQAMHVARKLVTGASAGEIAAYLHQSGEEKFGYCVSKAQLLPVALKIVGLRAAEVEQ